MGGRKCSYNGKHGLSSTCVIFEVENGLVVLFTNINVMIDGFRLNLSFNEYIRNFKFYVETHVF